MPDNTGPARPDRRTVVSYNGKDVAGSIIEHSSSSEQWSEYRLADQSIVRIRSVPVEFVRLDGRYDADGNPTYVVKVQNIFSVQSPAELRQKQ